MAPETLSLQLQGPEVDVWALGVLLFELFHNREPYKGVGASGVHQSIQSKPLRFDTHVPLEAQDLIRKLLTINPANRISIKEALSHPFLSNNRQHARSITPRVYKSIVPRGSAMHERRGSTHREKPMVIVPKVIRKESRGPVKYNKQASYSYAIKPTQHINTSPSPIVVADKKFEHAQVKKYGVEEINQQKLALNAGQRKRCESVDITNFVMPAFDITTGQGRPSRTPTIRTEEISIDAFKKQHRVGGSYFEKQKCNKENMVITRPSYLRQTSLQDCYKPMSIIEKIIRPGTTLPSPKKEVDSSRFAYRILQVPHVQKSPINRYSRAETPVEVLSERPLLTRVWSDDAHAPPSQIMVAKVKHLKIDGARQATAINDPKGGTFRTPPFMLNRLAGAFDGGWDKYDN